MAGCCCGTVVLTCCGANPQGTTLTATLSAGTGTCACLNGIVITLVYDGSSQYTGNFVHPGCNGATTTCTFTTGCEIGFHPDTVGGCSSPNVGPSVTSCSPFSLTFGVPITAGCCSAGSISVTLTP